MDNQLAGEYMANILLFLLAVYSSRRWPESGRDYHRARTRAYPSCCFGTFTSTGRVRSDRLLSGLASKEHGIT